MSDELARARSRVFEDDRAGGTRTSAATLALISIAASLVEIVELDRYRTQMLVEEYGQLDLLADIPGRRPMEDTKDLKEHQG